MGSPLFVTKFALTPRLLYLFWHTLLQSINRGGIIVTTTKTKTPPATTPRASDISDIRKGATNTRAELRITPNVTRSAFAHIAYMTLLYHIEGHSQAVYVKKRAGLGVKSRSAFVV